MILTVDDLSFGYGSRRILDGVSFTLESGCITSLIGRNGAGKTTLIKLIMGFLVPDQGCVLINGINSSDMKAEGRAKAIAYIPQYTSMVYKYSVLDSVLMGRAPHIMLFSHPKENDIAKAMEALRMLGIDHLAKRPCDELSGGERQLMMIARALAQDAEILILDEPTASLDYPNQLLVMETISLLKSKGYSILFSTHSPEQALMVSDRIILLQMDGKAISREPEELLDGQELSKLYGRKLCIADVETGKGRRLVCVPE